LKIIEFSELGIAIGDSVWWGKGIGYKYIFETKWLK